MIFLLPLESIHDSVYNYYNTMDYAALSVSEYPHQERISVEIHLRMAHVIMYKYRQNYVGH